MDLRTRDVDGGWAWASIPAAALWNAIIAGTQKNFGVVYVEMLDIYGASPSQTAWMGFTFSLCLMIFAPVSGYISDHFNVKTLVVVCSIVSGFAMAATALAPTLQVAIVTYGIVAGCCAGLIDAPFLRMFSKYFRRKRTLASGIAFGGSSLGSLLLPLLFRWSADKYSGRGSMFILGGVWLHTCVVATVLHTPQIRKQNNANEIQRNGGEQLTLCNDEPLVTDDTAQNVVSSHARSLHSSMDSVQITEYTADTPETNKVTNELIILPNKLSDHVEKSAMDSNYKLEEGQNRRFGRTTRPWHIFKDYSNFMNNSKLIKFVLVLSLNGFSYTNQLVFWPPWAREMGMTKLEASLMLTFAGLAELISRPLVGKLASTVNKLLVILVGNVCALLLCFIVYSIPHKLTMLIFAALFGCCGGTAIALGIPILTDAVGPERIGSAVGLFPMALGFSAAIGPPLLGLVKELTGYYVYSLRISGVGFALSAIIIVWELRHHCIHLSWKSKKNTTTIA